MAEVVGIAEAGVDMMVEVTWAEAVDIVPSTR
jgi:hypothetical protein